MALSRTSESAAPLSNELVAKRQSPTAKLQFRRKKKKPAPAPRGKMPMRPPMAPMRPDTDMDGM